ncbi:response regulator transcription factor [Maledivibacter halophilus]|uniref:Stage 0 sporulation protein A homolog n=1 Tax=Maledivibacter halophilus TaxID=36842 RepID=A0A1T5JSE1_9FIRM|nr:response regulator transcription factor [Maledivibacter halophilus]SKC54316.1 two-component system, OmpR family, response regulator VanR [Maledivibacter halophilus]
MQSILIVDDNSEILDILDYHLSKKGYLVYKAINSNEALKYFKNNHFSVIILDVMMEDEDGFSLCEKIREVSMVPILFLTAKSSEDDMVKGLLCGGDDYMIKPFSSKELLARVFALSRRENANRQLSGIRIHNLFIDKNINKVTVNNIKVGLTDIEYKILFYLISNRGNSVSVKEIFENVWGEKFILSSNNTVVVHIKNIRKKLQAIDSEFEYIHTVWGKGYVVY